MSATPVELEITASGRPKLLTVAPLRFRERLARRLYLKRIKSYAMLFRDAELLFAPAIKLDLLPTDVSHAMIALTGLYELEVTRRIARLATAGGTLVDVGANYGYYTCLWLGLNPSNRAAAFEASPRNVGALVSNLGRNGLDPRAQVFPFAAGEKDGEVRFTLGSIEQSGWGGLTPKSEEGDVTVPCKRLDRIVAKLGWSEVDVLKIDVEGAETWVLEGAIRLLDGHRIRHVFFEDNSTRSQALGIPRRGAQSLLRGLGYRVDRLSQTEWSATAPPRKSGSDA